MLAANRTNGLELTFDQAQQLVRWGRAAYPGEACGFLGGTIEATASGWSTRRVVALLPVKNDSVGTTTFRMNATDQLVSERRLDRAGLVRIGIYHTHPKGAAFPSTTDLERAHWEGTDDLLNPGLSFLIISFARPGKAEFRSFQIRGRRRTEDVVEEAVRIDGVAGNAGQLGRELQI